MKIIFTTDLHGSVWKYEKFYAVAEKFDADVAINSGDMLPKNKDLFRQDKFILRHLTKHFRKFDGTGIHYLSYLGNDDLKIFDSLFHDVCRQYQYIHNIAQQKIKLYDTEFIGMNWVTDYPFRLKDRCRMDAEAYTFQRQFGKGLLSTPNGWQEIDDWPGYAKTLPTLREELWKLPQPQDARRSIYIIHMPPANCQLDVCGHGETVGSHALYQFLEKQQPLLSLHGHIHESPDVSGIWKAKIGDTFCIQPGQMSRFTYVTIDTETLEIQRHVR